MIKSIQKGDLIFSADKSKLDIQVIHQYLSECSYWSKNIPIKVVNKAIEGSMCFGVYQNNAQIAFARAITDAATFAYLADVFVVTEYQGKGIGVWMMECLMNTLDHMGFRRILLATQDAHTFYEKYRFTFPEEPGIYMEKVYLKEYI